MKGSILLILLTFFLYSGTISAQKHPKPIEKGKCVLSYADGKDSLICFYKDWKLHGQWTEYYPDGNIRLTKIYKSGYPKGLMQYYPNGNLKRKETYSADNFMDISEGHLFDMEGNEIDFVPYMEQPQFPGGNRMLATILAKCIKYPVEAMKKRIEGVVVFKCTIDKDGVPVGCEKIRSVDPLLDKEAQRVIAFLMTTYRFTPGKREGNPVRMFINIPVRFRL